MSEPANTNPLPNLVVTPSQMKDPENLQARLQEQVDKQYHGKAKVNVRMIGTPGRGPVTVRVRGKEQQARVTPGEGGARRITLVPGAPDEQQAVTSSAATKASGCRPKAPMDAHTHAYAMMVAFQMMRMYPDMPVPWEQISAPGTYGYARLSSSGRQDLLLSSATARTQEQQQPPAASRQASNNQPDGGRSL